MRACRKIPARWTRTRISPDPLPPPSPRPTRHLHPQASRRRQNRDDSPPARPDGLICHSSRMTGGFQRRHRAVSDAGRWSSLQILGGFPAELTRGATPQGASLRESHQMMTQSTRTCDRRFHSCALLRRDPVIMRQGSQGCCMLFQGGPDVRPAHRIIVAQEGARPVPSDVP